MPEALHKSQETPLGVFAIQVMIIKWKYLVSCEDTGEIKTSVV